MADVIVREDPMSDLMANNPPDPADTNSVPALARAGLSRAVALGSGCAAILCAYIAVGSIRVEAGARTGVRFRIETIWSDFAAFLVRQGASGEIVFLVSALVLLSVLGSCLLIGLAFAIRDEDSRAE